MKLEIGLTQEQINTQFAPLAVMALDSGMQDIVETLSQVSLRMKTRDFCPADKLMQVMLSMLSGCETLSEVNVKLGSEMSLARMWGWSHFADQSSLSRTLDTLSLEQIEQLRHGNIAQLRAHSQVAAHDWRAYLWLDFDLSGLPCSARAQESQKGYFSGKKTQRDVSWHA